MFAVHSTGHVVASFDRDQAVIKFTRSGDRRVIHAKSVGTNVEHMEWSGPTLFYVVYRTVNGYPTIVVEHVDFTQECQEGFLDDIDVSVLEVRRGIR